jgi:hypothetical protein
MARRRRSRRSLGSTAACRLPSDSVATGCATEKGKTFCVGDRVERTLKIAKGVGPGTVIGIGVGTGNTGKKKRPVANVCFDVDEPRSLAYPYLFDELRKR